ncbi:hypothetical protein C1645_839926 [Glomus cerebriforme]|uniref:Uncharacterized protein n=1 Tax=Glomus cerebriforme TaxID=658196 RepID=A0A397S621_9GLOM|nr:hypothetical protein C1645_839926 [Glomus cerebriforme]
MWQISSGYRPFYPEGMKYDVCLALEIQEGKREKQNYYGKSAVIYDILIYIPRR